MMAVRNLFDHKKKIKMYLLIIVKFVVILNNSKICKHKKFLLYV